MEKHREYEICPRVERLEQQIPAEWKEFAGNPMQVTYYATKVNMFRENPDLLRPSEAFTAWAMKELRREMAEEGKCLSNAELKSIVCQEWRTDLARNMMETRLNRHGSKNGPLVRRSSSGRLYVTPHPASSSSSSPPTEFVLDAVASAAPRKRNVRRRE